MSGKRQSSGPVSTPTQLYLSFELGEQNWTLGFTIGLGQEPRKRKIAARDLKALEQEMARAKHAKTDRIDAGKLVLMLVRYTLGEHKLWSVVHVPSVAAEDARHLHRELLALKRDHTRHVNCIKGLLSG